MRADEKKPDKRRASRTSEQKIAKSPSIKGEARKSGGRARKPVGLTSGGLPGLPRAGLRGPRGPLTAWQKSAEAIVRLEAEGTEPFTTASASATPADTPTMQEACNPENLTLWACLASRPVGNDLPNRCIRTRTYGGVPGTVREDLPMSICFSPWRRMCP